MYYITEDINKNTCIKMVYLHEAFHNKVTLSSVFFIISYGI